MNRFAPLLLLALPLSASAGILDAVSDGVVAGNPPPSLDHSYADDRYPLMLENGLILAFPESASCLTLASPLTVDLLYSNLSTNRVYHGTSSVTWGPSGTLVNNALSPVGNSGTIAAGTRYLCATAYFEGSNEFNNAGAQSIVQWGSMSFGKNILGILYKDTSLNATDTLCSGGTDIHPSARVSDADWDLESTTNDDAILLESNRKLWVQASTTTSSDTLRVILACQ